MTKILGFDISSTTLAFALLEVTDQIKLVDVGYIKPIKIGSIIDKLSNTRDKVKNIILKYKPDFIAIEDIVKFMNNKSTANTIITLASYNRMVCLLAFDLLNKTPQLINILTIRSNIKKKAELKSSPKKEDLPLLLEKILNIKFPFEYNKKGNLKQENYDKSDAIACAYCYICKFIK